ncbi:MULTISPECIES: hypothetical protein [unclassified Coleofasciculus]|uniref:hypothetical protein n=1 Tax=unclassified Coleofasciculus TaxID=2692782 RepID=UPI00187FC220|nr:MULTISPECIES: hypothetical protein [unclassified Coleofasciculus]MBE9128722.1 hypothetical protein [Coleofasciculus sp. LEGE 07081]MBE9151491.1 hypothetical protein [Coleofasciculus sp. LEGE 07092]
MLQGLEDLQTAVIPVVIVTGRLAGWVSGLVSYLPVQGAIAENGRLLHPSNSRNLSYCHRSPTGWQMGSSKPQVYQRLKAEFP